MRAGPACRSAGAPANLTVAYDATPGAGLGRNDLQRRPRSMWRWDAFLPAASLWIREAEPLAPARACVELDGDGLVLSAVKPAESGEGMILRCCNATDEEREGIWWISPVPWMA